MSNYFGEVQRIMMHAEKNLFKRQQYKERVTSNMFWTSPSETQSDLVKMVQALVQACEFDLYVGQNMTIR